jgi:hypothetical protein
MAKKSIWRGVLTVVLCMALAAPARANTSLKTAATEIVIGIVAATAAVTVLIVVLIHKSKNKEITGCVSSAENGLTITDENDRQIYVLSGDTMRIKPGNRMKLQGKKMKPKGDKKMLIWETRGVAKSLGGCQP